MTTFTRTSAGETPTISVDVNRRLSKIDDNIYGGFMEHMGRCIYGGIYDPENSLSDEHGYRKDVLEALRELDIPVIRYPGGNFIATYNWQDGVGPRESRPKRPELAWDGVESNQIGTDEFMHWLDILSEGKEKRIEPYFCLNMATGTLMEALAWVEYCNGTKDTYYANLRRKNGHPEPYNIKYWALGNECYGPWQVGQMTATDYAKMAEQWGKALKLLDPSLVLILCGLDGVSSWDFEVLKQCITYIDMHSIHMYTASDEHLPNAVAPLAAERAIESAAALIDIARIKKNIPASVPQTKICFDEWNVWDPFRAPGDEGAEETYTLSDALAVGVWLNVFIRQSKYVGMANIAQSVNVISPLMTTKEGIVKQTTWWPLLLFSKYMRGWTVGVHVSGSAYDGATKPAWLQGTLIEGASWLDVSASINEEGVLSMAVVNIHEEKDFEVELTGVGKDVEVYTVTGDDWKVNNMNGKDEVAVKESKWDGEGKYKFGKLSLTILRWATGKKVVIAGKKAGEGQDLRRAVWEEVA